MTNEIIDTNNTTVAPGKAPLSDNEIIKQLSEGLQDITPDEIDGMSEEMNEAKKKEKSGESYRKDVDPTRSLKKLSKDVDESMKKLPIDKVDDMVNNEDLKRWCVIILSLAWFAASYHRYYLSKTIDEEMRKAILSWVDWNKFVQERILGFINKAITEPVTSWENQIWSAYNSLLKPLFDLVWLQENDVARRHLANYIAKSGLFPFAWANLNLLDNDNLKFKNQNERNILSAWIGSHNSWIPNVWRTESKDTWGYLTYFLDLFHVKYSSYSEEWDTKITIKPVEYVPHSYFEIINVEKTDLRNITQWRLRELQRYDLVIIYQNDPVYNEMRQKLGRLVKYKYWWKVCCIVFPEWFDWSSLWQQAKEILWKIVDTCPCLTDESVSQMIWKETKKIESVLPSKREFENKWEEKWEEMAMLMFWK